MATHLPPAAPSLDVEAPRQRSRALDALIEIGTTVALAVILYVVIQTFVVQTFRVEQQSMLPTLQPDQHLLIDKLTPRFDSYSRGDIIVFRPPDRGPNSVPFIKRVIGVGGDRVELREEAVWVNGIRLDEPYIADDGPAADETAEWDIPAGSLLVLGDHRSASVDSRSFGFVSIDAVVGRAWLRFWPLDTLTVVQTPTYADVPTSASP